MITIRFDINGVEPIYVQIAIYFEDGIIKGEFQEDCRIPSAKDFSNQTKINPATVLKSYNILENKGILYKKRGVGVFVSPGAKDIIIKDRKELFDEKYLSNLITEAKNIGLSKQEILSMIERKWDNGNQN